MAARAASWLWARQSDDGAWRSETYGLLASGQALTPFLLEALLDVPAGDAPRPPGGVARALAWVRSSVGPDGLCGLADPEVPEYPVYTTAHALRCLVRLQALEPDPDDGARIEALAEALLAHQLGPDLEPERPAPQPLPQPALQPAPQSALQPAPQSAPQPAPHPATGGWGFGPRPPGHPGHMDVCHTRHVLQALRLARRLTPAAASAAEAFLGFVQRLPSDRRPQPPDGGVGVPCDGGFYFSPVVLAANKGGHAATADGVHYFRSYASATCDGLLALLAAGVPPGDGRVARAAAWLRRRSRLDVVEGIPEDDPSGWGQAVHFTHLAARAQAWAAVGGPSGWRAALTAHLQDLQRDDGSFSNPGAHLMKEDDPLLATGLALLAATNARPPT